MTARERALRAQGYMPVGEVHAHMQAVYAAEGAPDPTRVRPSHDGRRVSFEWLPSAERPRVLRMEWDRAEGTNWWRLALWSCRLPEGCRPQVHRSPGGPATPSQVAPPAGGATWPAGSEPWDAVDERHVRVVLPLPRRFGEQAYRVLSEPGAPNASGYLRRESELAPCAPEELPW